MVSEIFTLAVGLLAVIYAGIAKFIQNKLIDRSRMEAMQKESKQLNLDFKKAKEKGDQAEMDKVMKKQMEMLPKMNKAMMAQFKPMIIILAVFFAFTWVVGHIDPTLEDDIKISLLDDGLGCDQTAGDGIYSACIEPENEGKWVVHVRSYRNGAEVGYDSVYFSYDEDIDDTYLENPRGEPLAVSTGKRDYYSGETVELYAQANDVSTVEATLDNGTAFRVDLPFTIPIVNVQRIYQPYWWFILISLISNLSIGFVLGKMKKKGEKK